MANNILLCKYIIPHCMDVSHFVYPLICQWTLGLLLPLGYYERICFLKHDVHT